MFNHFRAIDELELEFIPNIGKHMFFAQLKMIGKMTKGQVRGKTIIQLSLAHFLLHRL